MLIDSDYQLALKITVAVYAIVILVYSAYFFVRVRTYDGYNMGGRQIPFIPMVLTIVGTAVGGATLLGFMADAFQLGAGRLWLVLSLTLSVIILNLFFLKRLRRLGEQHTLYTVGDYAAVRYGPAARYPALIGNICAMAALTGLQFVAIATVLNLLFGLDRTTGIVVGCVFLTFKSYLGGLTAVIWTDAIQGTIQTLGVLMLLVVVYIASGGWGTIHANAIEQGQQAMLNIFGVGPAEIFIPLLTIGLAVLVRQDKWQRIWAARDIKTTVRAYWCSVGLVLITGGSIVAIGTMGNLGLGLTPDKPALIYYQIIQTTLPAAFFIVMLVVLIATILSCGDSFLIAGSTTLVSDLVRPRMVDASDQQMLRYSRLSVIAMGLISLGLALAVPRLVDLWVTGSAILASGIAIPLLAGLYWSRPDNRAGVVSMWTGLGVAIVWQLAGHPFGLHPVFVGLPACIVVFLVLALCARSSVDGAAHHQLARRSS